MYLAQNLLPIAAAAINDASYRAEKTTLDAAVSALRAAHPDLVNPAHTKGGSLIAASTNLRTELRKALPGHKFSVTAERFAGGNALRVSWTDGPSLSRVENIADKYQDGYFDGQTDCYNYTKSEWTEAFGAAKFVQTSRELSPQIQAWIMEPATGQRYPDQFSEDCAFRRRLINGLNIKAIKQPAAE